MYNDVTTCDMILKSPDGEKIALQTDHRTKEEIDQEKEYNTIIAIMRTLSAAFQNPDKILFSFKEGPPNWYLKLIGATAKLEKIPAFYMVAHGQQKPVPSPILKQDIIKIITKTMKQIAEKEGAKGNPEHDRGVIKKLFEKAKETGKREIALIGATAVATNMLKDGKWVIHEHNLYWYNKKGKGMWVNFQSKARKVLDGEDTVDDFLYMIRLCRNPLELGVYTRDID